MSQQLPKNEKSSGFLFLRHGNDFLNSQIQNGTQNKEDRQHITLEKLA